MPKIRKNFNLEVVTTFFSNSSAKFTNFEVWSLSLGLKFQVSVSDLLMKSRSRSFCEVSVSNFTVFSRPMAYGGHFGRVFKTVKIHQRWWLSPTTNHSNTLTDWQSIVIIKTRAARTLEQCFSTFLMLRPTFHRDWFWAHFPKNLFQNSWLGIIMAMKQSSHQLYRRVCVTRNHNRSSTLQSLKERVRPQAHLSASRTKKWSYWSVESAPTRPYVEHFAAHLKELCGQPVRRGPPVEKRCARTSIASGTNKNIN